MEGGRLVPFDMDMNVKKQISDVPTFVVVLDKKTSKSVDLFFVVMKRGENILPNLFHGIGVWTTQLPDPSSYEELYKMDYEEIWIPYEKIKYVKSLTYVKR